jgi:HK97 family phage major capsid protein
MAEWARKRALMEQRQVAWAAMKGLLDLSSAEQRNMTGDEEATYARHEKDIDEAERQIEIIERAEARSAILDAAGSGPPARAIATSSVEPREQREAEQRAAFAAYLRNGNPSEYRAYQADSDTEGGYLLAPQQVAAGLIANIKDLTFMRGLATVQTLTSAESLGVVTLDTDLGDSDWTAELTQTTDDTALRLGKRELKPQHLTKETRLSRALVRRAPDAEALVLNRLAYRFAITQEKAFLTGTGAGQPLGVFTASNDGIGTARDVSTGNTTTAITADGLIEAQMSTKAQYWNRGQWLFHRDAVKQIRKLKDGEGQYLWSPAGGESNVVANAMPGTILGRPYMVSEYAPNTFTTGLYVGLFGDFSYYWIVDSLNLEVQVLNELYARTNQWGYIGRMETDGMPILAEAFARVKLA